MPRCSRQEKEAMLAQVKRELRSAAYSLCSFRARVSWFSPHSYPLKSWRSPFVCEISGRSMERSSVCRKDTIEIRQILSRAQTAQTLQKEEDRPAMCEVYMSSA